jgi:hypothetical protein
MPCCQGGWPHGIERKKAGLDSRVAKISGTNSDASGLATRVSKIRIIYIIMTIFIAFSTGHHFLPADTFLTASRCNTRRASDCGKFARS